MKWITCSECEEEFRVITDSIDLVTFCPLCGSDLPEAPVDDEDSED
jgi:rRNA maturation endonuclease Nob1